MSTFVIVERKNTSPLSKNGEYYTNVVFSQYAMEAAVKKHFIMPIRTIVYMIIMKARKIKLYLISSTHYFKRK